VFIEKTVRDIHYHAPDSGYPAACTHATAPGQRSLLRWSKGR
jgi:hypothetical protein